MARVKPFLNEKVNVEDLFDAKGLTNELLAGARIPIEQISFNEDYDIRVAELFSSGGGSLGTVIYVENARPEDVVV